MEGASNMAFALLISLLIVSWVSGIVALQAGMNEAEEVSRREHLEEMRRYQ
jgi:hypothetical protein